MSPIPSIPAAFALSTATPSIPVDPGLAGQSTSAMTQYIVGTGGILFAVVAMVSVIGYFHHIRKKTNEAPERNSTRATFGKFLSTFRHRGSGKATAMAGGDWPADVEGGPEHANAIYTKFFHPTHWNLVESHPATPSAPAICVNDEAKETPASTPMSVGVDLSLDRDDSNGDKGKDDGFRDTQENAVQSAECQVEELPPYDLNTATNVCFKSSIIGTTDRPGGSFLSVPGRHRVKSSKTSSSGDAPQTGSEVDRGASPHDGIVTEPEVNVAYSQRGRILTPPKSPSFGALPSSWVYSPYDGSMADTGGVAPTSPPSSGRYYKTKSCSETHHRYSPYGRIDSQPDISREPTQTMPSRSSRSTRRYGRADMSEFTRALGDTIPKGERSLVRTVNYRAGLCDLAEVDETYSDVHSDTSFKGLDRLKPGDDKSRGVQGSRDDLRRCCADPDTFGPLYEGLDELQRIINELDGSDSEDGDLEDDEDEAERIISRFMDEQREKGFERIIQDFIDFSETNLKSHPATHGHVDRLKPMDDKLRSNGDISVHDSRNDSRKNWADPDTFRPLYEGLDLLQEIIDGLDDSDMEDGDSEAGKDDDFDEGSFLPITSSWGADNHSPESSSSMSDWGSLNAVTPPQRSALTLLRPPCVHQACVGPPVVPMFDEEQVFTRPPPRPPRQAYIRTHGPKRPLVMVHESPPPMSATVVIAPGDYEALMDSPVNPQEVRAVWSGSPPWLQSKAYIRTHQRSRSLLMLCDSPPQVSSMLQVVAPCGYEIVTESQVTPWFAEEVRATRPGLSRGLQFKANAHPHRPGCARPIVCSPFLVPSSLSSEMA